jgi:peptidylprolyl isomerase
VCHQPWKKYHASHYLDIQYKMPTKHVDVSHHYDGGVIKEIIIDAEEGALGPPPKGSVVKIHYVGILDDNGTQFDSSVDRGVPFEFVLGGGDAIRGWDDAVLSMKVGEKSKYTIHPDYAYGHHGWDKLVPPDSIVLFEIELLGFKDNTRSSMIFLH